MVPEGWERKPLSDVAEVRTGVAKGKTGLKEPVDIPYLRVANVQDGYIDLSEVKTIQIEKNKVDRYSLQVGDVLMTEGGDFDKLGRGDVWSGQIDPCLHQNHVFSVRVEPSILVPRFLASLSASHYGKSYFLSCAKKSTNLASLNSTQLKEFPVLIPPLLEQKKISQILSTWDQSITITEKLLSNSHQQKKALIQRLLSKTGGKFREVGLKDLVTFLDGKRKPIKSEERKSFEGKHPYYGATGIIDWVGGYIFDDDLILMGEDGENILSRRLPHVFQITGKSWINNHAHVLKPNDDVNITYLTCYLESLRYDKYNSGSAQPKLNKAVCEKIPVMLPSLAEQQKIAAVLSTADKELQTLQQKLTHLKQEKKSLMQQLLTGKRRVKPDPAEEQPC